MGAKKNGRDELKSSESQGDEREQRDPNNYCVICGHSYRVVSDSDFRPTVRGEKGRFARIHPRKSGRKERRRDWKEGEVEKCYGFLSKFCVELNRLLWKGTTVLAAVDFNKALICNACFTLIESTLNVRENVKAVEDEVIELQRRIVSEMTRLERLLTKLCGEVWRIEEAVKKSENDERCLNQEGFDHTTRKEVDWMRKLILKVSADLRKYRPCSKKEEGPRAPSKVPPAPARMKTEIVVTTEEVDLDDVGVGEPSQSCSENEGVWSESEVVPEGAELKENPELISGDVPDVEVTPSTNEVEVGKEKVTKPRRERKRKQSEKSNKVDDKDWRPPTKMANSGSAEDGDDNDGDGANAGCDNDDSDYAPNDEDGGGLSEAQESDSDPGIDDEDEDFKPLKRKRGRPRSSSKGNRESTKWINPAEFDEFVEAKGINLEEMSELKRNFVLPSIRRTFLEEMGKEKEEAPQGTRKSERASKSSRSKQEQRRSVGFLYEPVTGEITFRGVGFVINEEERCYECVICHYTLPLADPEKEYSWRKEEALRQHVKSKHLGVQEHERKHEICECDICGKPLKGGRYALGFHKTTHMSREEKEEEMKKPGETYLGRRIQQLQKDAIAKGVQVGVSQTCPVCSKVVEWHNWRRHLKRHEQKCTERVQCELCGKSILKVSYYNHEKFNCPLRHDDEKCFPCEQCGKAYKHQRLLQNHIRRRHVTDKLNKVQCEICGKELCSKLVLEKHIKQVHNWDGQKFPCDVCGKAYRSIYGLRRHRSNWKSSPRGRCKGRVDDSPKKKVNTKTQKRTRTKKGKEKKTSGPQKKMLEVLASVVDSDQESFLDEGEELTFHILPDSVVDEKN